MYKFVFFLVVLLSASASVESCAGNGLMCVYEDYCCSGYCNYYITPTTDDFGRCSDPPANWGHCGFDGDECVKNDDCCSYRCWNYEGNRSYCVPPPRPSSPSVDDVVSAPVPNADAQDLAPTPAPTQFPIDTTPAPAPTQFPIDTAPAHAPNTATAAPAPAHVPGKVKRKHKSRKAGAPAPSHHSGK
ncbi:hypothetical protein LIER_13956 [Lithospermum erythrorhizon]|uniref:Uncharacterized protein n=1 Tax=Lithospermum erythrorhizon TaxID=34254 RepID=A0AAV3PXA0_LITER